jgi:CrcB protein
MTQDSSGVDRVRAAQRRVDPELPVAPRRRADLRVLVTIALGGALGTAVRYALGRVAPAAAGTVPWSTLGINVSGSFVLGACITWLLARRPGDRYLRPLLAVGFLGGYTTFSTAMVESVELTKDGHALIALAYVAAGVVTAVVAVAGGVAAARRVTRC